MSPPPGSGLKDLIDEARRRHDDTRPEMLRALVGLYVQQPAHGDAEQARFATLARRLIDSVDVPVAAKHVRQIANRADLPRQFVLHLARGPLAIAGPVLRLSPVLDDGDLIDLAREAGPDHRAAIAARRDVSPDLAKHLAALIDAPAAQPPAGAEMDAPTANATPSSEVGEEALVDRPEGESLAVAGAMIAASDVHDGMQPTQQVEETANEAAPIEPGPQQAAPSAETAAAETAAAETPATEAAPRAEAPVASTAGAAPAPNLGFFTASPEERTILIARLLTLPPLALAERVAPPADSFTDALLEAGKADDREKLTALIAGALELRPATAAAIVADESGQAFAVAARVLGLSLAILSRLLFRLHPATGRSASEMTRLAQFFDSLPVMSAQHLVAQWRGERRATRERTEDAPPIRSYGVPRPVTHSTAETTDGRQRG